jgi:WD40 repeat protein
MTRQHTSWVNVLSFTADGSLLASGSEDTTAKVYRTSDGALVRNFSGGTAVRGLAIAPDGSTLTNVLFERTVQFWSVTEGTLLASFLGHSAYMYAVRYLPEGSLVATGGTDGLIKFWQIPSTTPVKTISSPEWIRCIAFSADGNLMASGGQNGGIRIWRVSDGALLRTLTGHSSGITAVDFSPDGSLLASSSFDNTVRLWRVSDGALLRTLTGHTNWVYGVSFSPDGQTLVSGGRDGTVRLWRVSDGVPLAMYNQETSSVVYSVAFSPDGETFAYGGSDGRVVLARNPFAMPKVAGTITFGDYGGVLPSSVTFELREPGQTEPFQTVDVAIGEGGTFRFTAPRRGAFDLSVKVSHWLRRTLSVDTSGGSVTDLSIDLLNGDIDGDNEVTLFDFGALVAAFGSTPGEANWNPDADLDGDEEVTLFDFGVLVKNFGAVGDE